MFGNILFKYFDYLSYFTVSFIIFCVNFFTFREILNLNIYLIIFFSLLHSIGSIFFIKHYLKNTLKNVFFKNKQELTNFFKKNYIELLLILAVSIVSFLIAYTYYSYIQNNNLFNLFYARTTVVALPSIFNGFQNLIAAVIFSITAVLFYIFLRSTFISRFVSFLFSLYFCSSQINLYNLIPSPLRDYAKAPMIFIFSISLIYLIKNIHKSGIEKLLIFFTILSIFFGLWVRADFLLFGFIFLIFLIYFFIVQDHENKIISYFQTLGLLFFLCIPHIIYQMYSIGDNFAVASSFVTIQNNSLGIINGLYDSGHIFLDEYFRNLIFFDKNYTINNIFYFPYSFFQKIVAIQINILNLPFKYILPPVGIDNFVMENIYLFRNYTINYFYNVIFVIFYISVILLIFRNYKIGFPIGLYFIILITYPLIQNQIRHYFFLEIMSFWSIGYLLDYIILKYKK